METLYSGPSLTLAASGLGEQEDSAEIDQVSGLSLKVTASVEHQEQWNSLEEGLSMIRVTLEDKLTSCRANMVETTVKQLLNCTVSSPIF